jgi:hypothetical protein
MLTYDEVTKLAGNMGRSAATWVSPNDKQEAGRILQGLNDGDPKILDVLSPPNWLSGEWAGESMTELLSLDGYENLDDINDMLGHFEEVADSAYWSEVERVCLFHTTED